MILPYTLIKERFGVILYSISGPEFTNRETHSGDTCWTLNLESAQSLRHNQIIDWIISCEIIPFRSREKSLYDGINIIDLILLLSQVNPLTEKK